MDKNQDPEDLAETSDLLSDLDNIIDQSSLVRDIVIRYQHLHNIEQVTGPCKSTEFLRRQIVNLENRLQSARFSESDSFSSPALAK